MRYRTTLNFLVGVLFIVSTIVAAYLIIRAVWSGFTSLDTGIASAITAGAGAALLAVINVTAQRVLDRRRDIEVRQRDKKAELYQSFMRVWFGVLLSAESRKAREEGTPIAVPLAELNDVTQQLILWSSDSVLKSFSDFKRYITNSSINRDNVTTMLKFEAVMFEFRKDLGHSNRGLGERDILAQFINDVDKLEASNSPKLSQVADDLATEYP